MVGELEASGLADRLVLLHCHIGSQIADIQVLKQATKEVTRIYAELVNRGIGLKYLDLGGGLGVNYDKGHFEEDAGINYSLQEYANAVIYSVKEVCDASDVAAPVIVTESGRALTAHHSVLIVPVLGAHAKDEGGDKITVPKDATEPVVALERVLRDLPTTRKVGDLLEAYHDANERLEDVRSLFSLGFLGIDERALAETLYWRFCTELLAALRSVSDAELPESIAPD